MLDDLISTLSESDFDFSGQLSVVRLERSGSSLEILLELRAFRGECGPEAWLLSCAEERLSLLRLEPIYGVELLTDHVLLAPYRDPKVQLAIRGPAHDPKHAVADLWEAHRAVVGDWFPFDTFFNRGMPLSELLASSAAIVAEGPSRSTRTYAEALAPHVPEVYTVSERPPQQWVEMAWQPEDPDLQLLLLDPNGYIVGKGFDARPVALDLLPPVV